MAGSTGRCLACHTMAHRARNHRTRGMPCGTGHALFHHLHRASTNTSAARCGRFYCASTIPRAPRSSATLCTLSSPPPIERSSNAARYACASPVQRAHHAQELETALEASLIRTGAGVAVAGAAPLPPLPAHLVQFAEAQRIVVLDAVRTKLPPLPAGDARAANGATNGLAGTWCGRVGRETLATAGHLSSADKVQAARLINLLSAYAVHDPETGYCQVTTSDEK